MRIRQLLVALAAAGCTGGSGGSAREEPPPPPIDAAAVVIDAVLEELVLGDGGLVTARRPREKRFIGIQLSSSPSGAIVAVDGRDVGRTPTYWEGEFTGGERCFSFRKAGHTTATYRFVPTRDGFVHGKLVRGPEELDACRPETPDGGVPDPEKPQPLKKLPRPPPLPDAAPREALPIDATPATAPPPPDGGLPPVDASS